MSDSAIRPSLYHRSIGNSFGCDRSGAIIVSWPGAIHLLAQIVLRVAVANWSGAIHLPAWWDSTSVIPVWRRSPPIVACVHASPVVKVFADTNALGQARYRALPVIRLGERYCRCPLYGLTRRLTSRRKGISISTCCTYPPVSACSPRQCAI